MESPKCHYLPIHQHSQSQQEEQGKGTSAFGLQTFNRCPFFNKLLHLHPCLYPCSQASTSWVRSSLENKVLSRMLLGGEMGEESLFCFWPYSLPYRQMSLISEPVCSSLAGICPSGISWFYFLHQAKSVSFSTSKAADVTDSLWSPVICAVGLHPLSTLVSMWQQREAWVSSVYPIPSQPSVLPAV